MRIEKRSYSAHPWRLIDSQGREVEALPERFDHPDIGATIVTGTVSGATRKECEVNALRLLEAFINRRTVLR
jgi:hypothetical protein